MEQTNPSPTTTPTAKASIEVEPVVLITWVDQLRVRALPSKSSRVVFELQQGDTVLYFHERTVEKEKVNLRGADFFEPWLKIEIQNGQTGWIYGGGVKAQ